MAVLINNLVKIKIRVESSLKAVHSPYPERNDQTDYFQDLKHQTPSHLSKTAYYEYMYE